jgi:hypothetical protein
MGRVTIVAIVTLFLLVLSLIIIHLGYFVIGFSIFFIALYFSMFLVSDKILAKSKHAIQYHVSVIGGWVAGMMVLLLSKPIPSGEKLLFHFSLLLFSFMLIYLFGILLVILIEKNIDKKN